VTRKRILDMAANEDSFVIGFHMPFPGIGHVERAQIGYRWCRTAINCLCEAERLIGKRVAFQNEHKFAHRTHQKVGGSDGP
jgi:hypothetical protein